MSNKIQLCLHTSVLRMIERLGRFILFYGAISLRYYFLTRFSTNSNKKIFSPNVTTVFNVIIKFILRILLIFPFIGTSFRDCFP